MSSKNYSIYCLVNPVTDTPFYVGATNMILDKRLRAHITQRIATKRDTLSKKRISLINYLVGIGNPPTIRLLASVTKTRVNSGERMWYRKFIRDGHEMMQHPSFFNYKSVIQRHAEEGRYSFPLKVDAGLKDSLIKLAESNRRKINDEINIAIEWHLHNCLGRKFKMPKK